MKKTILLLLFCWITAGRLAAQPGVQLIDFASGFTNGITDIAHAGDNRLFVVEQMGYIKIVQPNGTVLPTPFLDISSKITPTLLDSAGEQGLLGLAFSPNFKTDGYFYINYTNKTGIGNTVIARYQVSADSNVADAGSEQVLLEVPQPYANHNGGVMKFGNDGYLYIGVGDGGFGGDPQNRAQNLDSLLGKILRIDVAGGGGYTIPPSNPFVNTAGRDEIWAYGLRNPWRFSFDRLTHDLWIADVGQDHWEEINYESGLSTGGENYGWRCYEGTHAYNTSGCNAQSSYTSPVYDYNQDSTGGCSAVGGYVYRGTANPLLYGNYLFADYCSGKIYVMNTITHAVTTAYSHADYFFSTFGEDREGELYIGERGEGRVYKLAYTPSAIAEINGAVRAEKIFPAPNNGNFTCQFQLDKATEVEISITDATGKQLYSQRNAFNSGTCTVQVDMKKPTPGLYILQLKTAQGTRSSKFTIL